jgi:muramoyltetrapeptide carboxypeptidase
MKKAKALKKGDAIGVIAPAGKIAPVLLRKGIERLRQFGFEVVEGRYLSGSFRYFSGTDRERGDDLQWMFKQDVKAILCARGGYGSSRLIPYLKMDSIRDSGKIFIGCSDITTLLLYFSQEQVPVFHGPMISHFGRIEDPLTNRFLISMLTSPEPIGVFSPPALQILKGGTAVGRLTGGCLSLLCSSIGTPYEIDTAGKILFLEEVNEAPYRIDRMLTHLKQAGKFKGVKGVLIGTILNCDPPEGSDYTLREVIDSDLGDLKCPIFSGLPFGHGNENITLPFGLKVRMDADSGSLSFLESPVK